MTTIFQTHVIGIGEQAPQMIDEANMIILFGEGAPADLAEYCYQIEQNELSGGIVPGGYLVIDRVRYLITAVGDLVERNLSTLGHITISFDGSDQVSLPGTLHVAADTPVNLVTGTSIELYAS